jgi:hypothetical protein
MRRQQRDCYHQVVSARDLQIRSGSLDNDGPLAEPLQRLGFIGRRPAIPMRSVEGFAKASVAKHLWSERTPQTRPIDRLNNLFALTSSLERISGWRRENSADGVRLNTIQQPVYILPGDTRARGVMDQYPVVGCSTTR